MAKKKQSPVTTLSQPSTAPDQDEIITTTAIRPDDWPDNPLYMKVAPEYRPHRGDTQCFDTVVMDVFDRLCPDGSHATLWGLTLTSNSSLFLSPKNSSQKTHHFKSPNLSTAELSSEAGGIVATLFAMHEIKYQADQKYSCRFTRPSCSTCTNTVKARPFSALSTDPYRQCNHCARQPWLSG